MPRPSIRWGCGVPYPRTAQVLRTIHEALLSTSSVLMTWVFVGLWCGTEPSVVIGHRGRRFSNRRHECSRRGAMGGLTRSSRPFRCSAVASSDHSVAGDHPAGWCDSGSACKALLERTRSPQSLGPNCFPVMCNRHRHARCMLQASACTPHQQRCLRCP
jgi:hypothetical protein